MSEKKGAIKKSTLDAIGDAVRSKEGSTEPIPVNALADRITALPIASEENKLIPFIVGDATLELTETELQGLQEPLREYAFAYTKAKSIELPEHITTLPRYCFKGATVETIKTYANTFKLESLGIYATDNTTVNLYLLANDFSASTTNWFYNNISKKFNLHFNNEEAYSNYLYAASQLTSGSTFQNIVEHSIYFGENLATEVNVASKLTTFRKTQLFFKVSNLEKIKFLGNVTYIPDYGFGYCYSLKELDFTANTIVPTLAGSMAFVGIKTDYQIKVRAALYNDWIAATNWSNIASHIVAV